MVVTCDNGCGQLLPHSDIARQHEQHILSRLALYSRPGCDNSNSSFLNLIAGSLCIMGLQTAAAPASPEEAAVYLGCAKV
jgi:hypothetical protein